MSDQTEDLSTLARPILAKSLRKISARVKGINTRYGRNPEKLIAEQDEIAADLERLAGMLDGN